MRRIFILAAFIAALPSSLRAEQAPHAGRLDSRVREVAYNRDNVVAVNATFGVSTMIILAEDEKIETLALGDTIAWKIEPNRKGNIIFVKPVEKDANSNLNVVTDKRLYTFILRSGFREARAQIFKIRFRYPDDEVDAKLLAAAREKVSNFPATKNMVVANANSDYGYKGSSAVKPLAIFDDGVKTWFRFPADGETPAIFIVDPQRKETLVNFRREGAFLVVDKVNFQWTLRNGKETTCVFNRRLENVTEPTGLEPYAPQKVSLFAGGK